MEGNTIAQIRSGDPHGLYKVFVGLVGANGYNYGTAGEGAASVTVLSPYQVKYAQSAEIAMPDRTVVDFTGGDVWTGSYVYGITSLGTFQLTTSTIDADLIAMTSGGAIDNTLNSLQTIFAENIMRPTPPQCWMMVVFRIQSKEQGSKGANKFLTIVLPRTWVAPKGVAGAPAFQTAGTYGYTIVPTIGDRMPWGPAFGETSTTSTIELDQEGNETPSFYIITDYPVHTITYIAAATASASITLPFKPAGVQADYASPDSGTQRLQCYINGVQTDATSVTLSSRVVVVPSGSTFVAGDLITIFYETEYKTS